MFPNLSSAANPQPVRPGPDGLIHLRTAGGYGNPVDLRPAPTAPLVGQGVNWNNLAAAAMQSLMTGNSKPAPTYDTQLTPEQEQAFLAWKAANAPQDSGQDYDLRGAFLSNSGKDARGHGTDQFKKPNHPTFSVESQYSGQNGLIGGRWDEQDGKTYFYASPTNLSHHTPEELQSYFKEVEPDVTLVLPGKQNK